jgi:hypothetical protein
MYKDKVISMISDHALVDQMENVLELLSATLILSSPSNIKERPNPISRYDNGNRRNAVGWDGIMKK